MAAMFEGVGAASFSSTLEIGRLRARRRGGGALLRAVSLFLQILACVASVSLRFRSKERGTRVKDRAKNGASERAGRGGEERKERFPSFPSPLFHFLVLVSFLARSKPRSIPFLSLFCSETKRKRLLRRLFRFLLVSHKRVSRVLLDGLLKKKERLLVV